MKELTKLLRRLQYEKSGSESLKIVKQIEEKVDELLAERRHRAD